MEIIINYQKILFNYSNFFYKNIIKNNKKKELYIKGLNIIHNIFTLGYERLDNNEIENICEKGYIYFIEFINQINLSTLSESSFELTLKDAILFTYKKTILNFSNISIRNNFEQKNLILLYIIDKFYILYYSNLLKYDYDDKYINLFYNIINKNIKNINLLEYSYIKNINNFLLYNNNIDIEIIIKYIEKKEYKLPSFNNINLI